MSRFKVHGFVLRGISMGETSRVLTLFTQENGKLKAVAKGARKAATSKGGTLELFSHVACIVYRREGAELGMISSTDVVDDFSAIAADPKKFGYASAYCEIIDKATKLDQPILGLYDLLGEFLQLIASQPANKAAALFWASFLKTLALTGYEPQLFGCAVCGKVNKGQAAFFNASMGGIVCSRDARQNAEYGKLTAETVKLLQAFASEKLTDLAAIETPQQALRRAEQFILAFDDYHTGLHRNLRSFKFLSQLKKH